MSVPVSVTIIVRDGLPWIKNCLASITCTRDIIVVLDPASSDGTRAYLQTRGVRVVEQAWLGFGRQQQFATVQCANDWVFKLDSDEEMSPALNHFLADFNPADADEIYCFTRRNLVDGQWIRGGGWWPDAVRRLFNRTRSAFTDDIVHETIRGPQERLHQRDEQIIHHAYGCIDDFIDKVRRYSTLGAETLHRERRGCGPLMALLRGLLAFFKCYVIKLGLRDGRWGLVIALSTAAVTMLKHLKAGELKKNQLRRPA